MVGENYRAVAAYILMLYVVFFVVFLIANKFSRKE